MVCACNPKPSLSSRGFTLLELSVVLLVLSLMLGGLLAVMTQETRISKTEELKQKMDAIEYALVSYSKRSDTQRLPCPANPTLAVGHVDFGFAGNPNCKTGTGNRALPTALSDSAIAIGTVPVRTIGLPDEYAFDPWGNRFSYAVSISITHANALAVYPVTFPDVNSIVVESVSGFPIGNFSVVIISHGPNGYGAFTRTGVRRNVTTADVNEISNSAWDGSDDALSNTLISGHDSNSSLTMTGFDDIVRYYPRSSFRLADDTLIP
ncbi:MAG: prepilin-type N-terminal cleavage/methylation domain-containing protein [Alphaproteobacteria bacterium]|nr:prepilin-type N-terminal cleavage/methylation domain-containing protein [Alphaproteobacteria bacterium]